jgi:hypothetical protein
LQQEIEGHGSKIEDAQVRWDISIIEREKEQLQKLE